MIKTIQGGFVMKDYKVFKGDTHLHTTASDGKFTPEQLIEKCKKHGFDYMIVTDHNANAIGEKSFMRDGLLVIPGEEYTGDCGHLNIWGSNAPKMNGERPTEPEQYIELEKQAHKNGCTVSVNHPFDNRFMWQVDIESFNMDCAEVWNSPMHGDNMICLEWWHKTQLGGRRIPLVGGSDYHRDYAVTNLLGVPTTYVYCHDNTEEEILRALRNGNSFVTNSPKATRLFLSVGEAVPGEVVEFSAGIKGRITADRLIRGMRIEVYNNDTLIYTYKASKTGCRSAEFEIPEKGFVRAQVLFDYGTFSKAVYKKAVKVFAPIDATRPIPSFAYALTNPIYLV